MVTLNFWKVQFQTPNSGVRSPDFPKVVYDIPETFGKFNFRVGLIAAGFYGLLHRFGCIGKTVGLHSESCYINRLCLQASAYNKKY
jgi:hypothetical protein